MKDTKIDVRLVGGADESQGRVEIGFYGAWGRVCDDFWDIQDAKVVCKMLGYPYAIAAIGPSTFGDGSGRVWVDNVWCKGEESTLLDCPLQGWGVLSCRQGDYAGVICSSEWMGWGVQLCVCVCVCVCVFCVVCMCVCGCKCVYGCVGVWVWVWVGVY